MASGPGSGLLAAGERVLFIDHKGRRYLVPLQVGGAFHTHAGIVAHDSVIGQVEGSTVAGSTGRNFIVVRPTLADVVVKMPRGAQVIYPKDLGAILVAVDAGPGMSVLEAGVGSGALSMALIRAGCMVIGYEIREDFARVRRKPMSRHGSGRSSAPTGTGSRFATSTTGSPRAIWTGWSSTFPNRGGYFRTRSPLSAQAASSVATCPRSIRPLSYEEPSSRAASAWNRPSRSCTAPGT